MAKENNRRSFRNVVRAAAASSWAGKPAAGRSPPWRCWRCTSGWIRRNRIRRSRDDGQEIHDNRFSFDFEWNGVVDGRCRSTASSLRRLQGGVRRVARLLRRHPVERDWELMREITLNREYPRESPQAAQRAAQVVPEQLRPRLLLSVRHESRARGRRQVGVRSQTPRGAGPSAGSTSTGSGARQVQTRDV